MSITTEYGRRMDLLACRLIMAYLCDSDDSARRPYIDAVFRESGLSPEAFELANWTACNVAQIHKSPAARTRARKVVTGWLTDLVMGETA